MPHRWIRCVRSELAQGQTDPRVQARKGPPASMLVTLLGHCTSPLQQVRRHLQTSRDYGLEQMPWCSVEDLIQVPTVQSGQPGSPLRKLGPAPVEELAQHQQVTDDRAGTGTVSTRMLS